MAAPKVTMESGVRRRVGVCGSCGTEEWKYRCPGCDRLSCSLQCVSKHKLEHSCDGKRCKTSYISLSQFDDNQLLSDYYFLEEVTRFTDSAHRQRVVSNREHFDSKGRRQLFYRLRNAANRRGTRLQLLAPGMTLHSINTSRTVWHGHKRECEILWRVHLNFPQCSVEYQEKSVPEATLLSSLLSKYLHPTESDPIARHRLGRYVESGGVAGVEVLMMVKMLKATSAKYHRLDLDKTLSQNLSNKDVVEFPVLHVVLRSEVTDYQLYSSGSEDPDCRIQSTSTVQAPPPATESTEGFAKTCPFTDVASATNSSLQLIAQMYSDNEGSD